MPLNIPPSIPGMPLAVAILFYFIPRGLILGITLCMEFLQFSVLAKWQHGEEDIMAYSN